MVMSAQDQEELHREIDEAIGQGTIPTYQWYLVGDMRQLEGDQIIELEWQFFAGREHEPNDIELHPWPQGTAMRIRHASCRRLDAELKGEAHPLVHVHHYAGGIETSLDFMGRYF